MAHVVACEGYEVSPVRTGGESVIGNLVNDMFASKARADGTVKKVKKDVVIVEYDDPNIPDDHFFVGRRYGIVTGKTIPHDIYTDMVPEQRVFEGYVVAWNSGFFERDLMAKGGVVWKRGILANVALVDGPETIEDSCRVGSVLSDKLTMPTSYVKEITGTFEQAISGLVELGTEVDSGQVLAYLEDSVTAGTDAFSEMGLSGLDSLARLSPKAEKDGTVRRIEVIYNGDVENASEAVRDLIQEHDALRARDARKYKDGRVTTGYASDLPVDTFIVRITIDSTNAAADCDKIVVGHQLKTVISSVLVGENKTEDGQDIDVFFAGIGINDRIVMAVIYDGMLTVLVQKSNEEALDAFFEAIK